VVYLKFLHYSCLLPMHQSVTCCVVKTLAVQESKRENLLLEPSAGMAAGNVVVTALHAFHCCSRIMVIGGAVTAALDLAHAAPSGCMALHRSIQWGPSMPMEGAGVKQVLEEAYVPVEVSSRDSLSQLGASVLLRPDQTSPAAVLQTLAQPLPPAMVDAEVVADQQLVELELWLCQACADHQTLRTKVEQVAQSGNQAGAPGPQTALLQLLFRSLQSLWQHMPGSYNSATASSCKSLQRSNTDECQSGASDSLESSVLSITRGPSLSSRPTSSVSTWHPRGQRAYN
jgi:hypothetical protein